MNETKQHILGRLRSHRLPSSEPPDVYTKPLGLDREGRIAAFTERMQAVRGEVHRLSEGQWPAWLRAELTQRGLHRVLLGHGPIADAFARLGDDGITLRRYAHAIEDWKDVLFHQVDVAITGARAGLAESGSLVLWPDADEPRLMSLVPPVHVAVLRADRLFDNFAQLIAAEDWAAGMPSNALLISGPSKTADIEQTLAYGIHGPKTLITLLID